MLMPRSEATIRGSLGPRQRYLITISCCRKKDDINKYHLQDVISWLQDNGVEVHENVFSDHGTYRQAHWHGICLYSGRFKGLTRFDWTSGPDDEAILPFKIAWSRIHGKFGLGNVRNYLDQNRKPQGLVEQEELVDTFYKKVEIEGYPKLYG